MSLLAFIKSSVPADKFSKNSLYYFFRNKKKKSNIFAFSAFDIETQVFDVPGVSEYIVASKTETVSSIVRYLIIESAVSDHIRGY